MPVHTLQWSTEKEAKRVREELIASHTQNVSDVFFLRGVWCVRYEVYDPFFPKRKPPEKTKRKHGTWYSAVIKKCTCPICLNYLKQRKPRNSMSPNTLKIREEERALRMRGIKSITPSGHGPNRAARRNAKKTLRLRPKMGAEKRKAVMDWKEKTIL